ncbi:MAG: Uma2 family endonuclease [Candidatus Latescibacteria bacterium]|nr:Uma2 family endonuclease [Candidatus Latescibacterota bacterium]
MAVETQRPVETRYWQFTVADFMRMGEAGILSEDDRVELIDGEVRAMSPVGPTHGSVINRLNMFFVPRLAGKVVVSIQNPVQLNDFTEPLPDVTVLRYREDFYGIAHPGPGDVLLLIEVADSSLRYDRGEKQWRYAQAGIPEYWVVDIVGRRVFQYVDPEAAGYRTERIFGEDDVIDCAFAPDVSLLVSEIF